MSKASAKPSPTEPGEGQTSGFWRRLFVRKGLSDTVLIPVLAVFTALVIGGLIVAFTNGDCLAAWRIFFHAPLGALAKTWTTIRDAYSAMFLGAFGNPGEISRQLGIWITTGKSKDLLSAIRPVGDSLLLSVPYILAGLGVAVGFQCNLFNIGAEGQLYIGGLATAIVGFAVHGLPWYIQRHSPSWREPSRADCGAPFRAF